jgi:hypothetical protein
MNIVVITKYLGPTNTRGPRIKASDGVSSMIIPWHYRLGYELPLAEMHERAVDVLISRLCYDVTARLSGWSKYHLVTILQTANGAKGE